MFELYKAYGFLSTINIVMWYALVFTAIIFCVSSLDDCFFDIVYWISRIKNKFFKGKEKKLYVNMNKIKKRLQEQKL